MCSGTFENCRGVVYGEVGDGSRVGDAEGGREALVLAAGSPGSRSEQRGLQEDQLLLKNDFG